MSNYKETQNTLIRITKKKLNNRPKYSKYNERS